ncbi:MAG: hypothetical protein ACRDF4_04960, partial [Rhabdochlamydiaceae bacterium]
VTLLITWIHPPHVRHTKSTGWLRVREGNDMSFGPAFVLDKSTLQGLSFDDVVMLTRYYRHPIPPILLRELTSDLVKEARGKSDQEMKKKVAFLAAQVSLSHWAVLPDAYKMACNELLSVDVKIPMNGAQAPCDRAVAVTTPQMGRGFFLDEHPMLAMLRNWANENFSDEDLRKAKTIRDEDSSVDLVSLYQGIEEETEEEAKVSAFGSLCEAVEYADAVCFFHKTPRQVILQVARHFFQDHTGHIGTVMRHWRRKGRPELRYFAPYAMYVYRVEIVYHYCLLGGFIKRGKKSKAHLDMQYFYYLPFCQVFSSDDKEIVQLFPFFQRPDQEFVTKADLQRDLKNLSVYLTRLSEEESISFYEEFGPYPPDLEGSFTVNMWKKFMRPREKQAGKRSRPSPEAEVEIKEQFREIQEAVAKQQATEKMYGTRENPTIFL